MKEIRDYLAKQSKSRLSPEEIKQVAARTKAELGVDLPADYLDFLSITDGFHIYGNDLIVGHDIVERNYKELKQYVDEWEYPDPSTFEPYVMIGCIFENGYFIYLNESKYYVLVEDILDRFTLDGKDQNLYRINSIYDIALFIDYYGDDHFNAKFHEVFAPYLRHQEEIEQRHQRERQALIDQAEQDVAAGRALKICLPNQYELYLYLRAKTYSIKHVGIEYAFRSDINPSNITIHDHNTHYSIEAPKCEDIIIDKQLLTPAQLAAIRSFVRKTKFIDRFKWMLD